jgi:hypothetical protein
VTAAEDDSQHRPPQGVLLRWLGNNQLGSALTNRAARLSSARTGETWANCPAPGGTRDAAALEVDMMNSGNRARTGNYPVIFFDIT